MLFHTFFGVMVDRLLKFIDSIAHKLIMDRFFRYKTACKLCIIRLGLHVHDHGHASYTSYKEPLHFSSWVIQNEFLKPI